MLVLRFGGKLWIMLRTWILREYKPSYENYKLIYVVMICLRVVHIVIMICFQSMLVFVVWREPYHKSGSKEIIPVQVRIQKKMFHVLEIVLVFVGVCACVVYPFT